MPIKNIIIIALIAMFGLLLGARIGRFLKENNPQNHYYDNACMVDTKN